MQEACKLGIMGIHPNGNALSDFMPASYVTRAEFGTVLSRMLWGNTYEVNNEEKYYVNHLKALQKAKIMTQIENPLERIELRQWVRLMLYRTAHGAR
jgi:hypothetical protein